MGHRRRTLVGILVTDVTDMVVVLGTDGAVGELSQSSDQDPARIIGRIWAPSVRGAWNLKR